METTVVRMQSCLGQMANAYGRWHHLTGHPAEVCMHFSILQVLKLLVRADHSFLLNGSAIPEASSSTSGSPEDICVMSVGPLGCHLQCSSPNKNIGWDLIHMKWIQL